MAEPERVDSIEIPIPGTGKTVPFNGGMVFLVLWILAGAYVGFYQLGQVHEALEKLRADLASTAAGVNCKLDLDIYMYGRPPEQFKMRDMPRQLFSCLPEWVGESAPIG